jgi:hypothetical protein
MRSESRTTGESAGQFKVYDLKDGLPCGLRSSRQVVEAGRVVPEFGVGRRARGRQAAHRRLENPEERVSHSAHTNSFIHAIAAKISCVAVDSVGVIDCFIDSALK